MTLNSGGGTNNNNLLSESENLIDAGPVGGLTVMNNVIVKTRTLATTSLTATASRGRVLLTEILEMFSLRPKPVGGSGDPTLQPHTLRQHTRTLQYFQELSEDECLILRKGLLSLLCNEI